MSWYIDQHDRVLFDQVSAVGEDFSSLQGREWDVMESRFERCRFDGVKTEFCFGSGQRMSEYLDCTFDRSRITSTNPGRARFIRCSFRDVRLRKSLFNHAEFLDCVFTGRLREINFNARLSLDDKAELGRTYNRYERNDFSGARLKGVAFKGGVNLLDQRLPQEDGYLLVDDAEAVIPAAAAEVLTWPDTAEKDAILLRLDIQLEYDLHYGQRQLLYSPHDWVSRDGVKERAYERLSEVLRELGARRPGPAPESSAGEAG